jgi:hypothetical protein
MAIRRVKPKDIETRNSPAKPVLTGGNDSTSDEEPAVSKSSNWDGDTYKVGYKKPPKSGQFKKGCSGNRSGRPKGAKSIQTIVKSQLLERIKVRTEKGSKTMSKLEALTLKQTEKASKGDLKAFQYLADKYDKALLEDVAKLIERPPDDLSESDQAAMTYLRERILSEIEDTRKEKGDD